MKLHEDGTIISFERAVEEACRLEGMIASLGVTLNMKSTNDEHDVLAVGLSVREHHLSSDTRQPGNQRNRGVNCQYQPRGRRQEGYQQQFSSRVMRCYKCNLITKQFIVRLFKHVEGCMDHAATSQPSPEQQINKMTSDPANQIIVRGICKKVSATFFIDTRSSVSLVSNSFVPSIDLREQIMPTRISITSFSSTASKTYGEIELDVKLAEFQVKHKIIVTDLVDTHFLIGLDLLKTHYINIDIKRRCITSRNGQAPFIQQLRQLKKTHVVRLSKPYTIPANTVMFIKAQIPTLGRDDSSYSGFIEPNIDLLDKGLLLDYSAMCLTEYRTLPLRISNLTDSPVTV